MEMYVGILVFGKKIWMILFKLLWSQNTFICCHFSSFYIANKNIGHNSKLGFYDVFCGILKPKKAGWSESQVRMRPVYISSRTFVGCNSYTMRKIYIQWRSMYIGSNLTSNLTIKLNSWFMTTLWFK